LVVAECVQLDFSLAALQLKARKIDITPIGVFMVETRRSYNFLKLIKEKQPNLNGDRFFEQFCYSKIALFIGWEVQRKKTYLCLILPFS